MRRLIVVKWFGTLPETVACTYCHRQFSVPLADLIESSRAQGNLKAQFARHMCERHSVATLKALQLATAA